MFAIDTNLIVYAHNTASPFNTPAKIFLEQVMNTRNVEGQLAICFPAQVLLEFVHIITWERLEAPVSLPQTLQNVQEYVNSGVMILTPQPIYILTFIFDFFVKRHERISDRIFRICGLRGAGR